MEETATPVDIDSEFRGVPTRAIYDEWKSVKMKLGNPPLKSPIIINDPKCQVHFGITLNWQVMLNLSSIPPGLHGNEMLAWLKTFPMHHEIAHYVICPYDGITHARLMLQVSSAWESARQGDCLFIVNYFSDVIVNNELYHIAGEPFFESMKKWVEYTVVETFKSGYNVSLSYLVFVLIHEIVWKKQFIVFNYPEVVWKLALRIVDIITFSESWYDAIFKITIVLKSIMAHDGGNGKDGRGQEVLTASMKSAVSREMTGEDSNNNVKHDGTSSIDDERKKDDPENQKNVNQGKGKKQEKNENACDGKGGDGKQGKIMVRIKKREGETRKPFDMTFFMGDPVAEKTKGNMDEGERRNEKNELVSIISKTGMGFSASASLMKAMHVAENDDHAWRIWLRARAKGIVTYDTIAIKENRGGSKVPSEWEWDMPLKDWNFFMSEMNFPPWPFPPFAAGTRDFKGSSGNRTLPDVRDLLLLCDSSGSMTDMMKHAKNEKWTKSLSISQRTNNKFNLSSMASFAVLHAAVQKGAKVAIVNFSNDVIATPWMDPVSTNVDKAEKTILKFMGSGTVLPLKKIQAMLDGKSHCFVMVITDSNLHNWNAFFHVIDSLKGNDHEISMIFISDDENPITELLSEKLDENNILIHRVSHPRDLFKITVKEINRIYR